MLKQILLRLLCFALALGFAILLHLWVTNTDGQSVFVALIGLVIFLLTLICTSITIGGLKKTTTLLTKITETLSKNIGSY